MARAIVANDLQMLTVLDQQAHQAEDHLGLLLPQTPFAVLTSVPGWATIRASGYGDGSISREANVELRRALIDPS